MDTSFLYVGIFIILLGIVVKHFKLYFLIAGYNTMSKADKKKVKIEKVATLLRNVFTIIGVSIILLGITSSYLENPEMASYLFFPVVIVSVIYMLVKSNSKAYKN
ncbi:DUF3784 domain-containing protein [Aequorivita lipolytica]|uniref:DUF3784 domain-containing protein n=1 Tax=Aequorivita lipolytica TaxID=153267 RepID=A0A5C6YRP4_9FLAO|nr:DUF3784 domain-containing protein [Aequorivita lipolytica]TXD70064.1 DUF3784 domain-containing protein [Aequorivita lipolytica]SRX50473.1 hypothetical protein AEQU2_00946 [Aequorivita lipolytica]